MREWQLPIENPGAGELRKFGLLMGVIIALLFGLLLPWAFAYAWPLWPWIVTGIFWLWSLAHPASLFSVYRVWLIFGQVAGRVNTRIILGIVFYLVFLPVGFSMRLLGKDPMARRLDSSARTYRVISDPLEKDHVEKPY